MTTDLAPHAAQNNGGGIDLLNAGAGLQAAVDSSAVVQWAQRLLAVRAAVDLVVETPFVPASYWPLPPGMKLKDMPGKVAFLPAPNESPESYQHRRAIACSTATLAALHGEQYGWQPGQSWRLLYVVSGRVGIGYEGVLALMRGAGFRVAIVERDADHSVIEVAPPGDGFTRYEFTMADAERAGYVPGKGPNSGKDWGGNEKYITDPKTMLLARNVTIAARIEAPHVIAGMPVVELMDDEPKVAEPVQLTAAPADRPAQGEASDRLRAAISAVGAARDAVDDARAARAAERDGRDDPAEWPIDEAQWRKINARFVELGVTGLGRDRKRLAVISEVIGRTVARGSELTATEAQLVLDNLAGVNGSEIVLSVLHKLVDPEIVREDGEPTAATQDDVEDEANTILPDDQPAPAEPAAVADPWAEPGSGQ